MTVAELIEELSKHPQHHTVLLETSREDPHTGATSDEWHFVGEVEGQNPTGIGPVVRIVAESTNT